MREEGWTQCQICGDLHKVTTYNLSDDCLYIQLHCPKCRDDTSHIWVGEDPEDVYIYGNLNVDSRYYKYNTK